MADDLLTSVVQIAGNLTGMGIKYGLLMALPGIMGAMATAPITMTVAGLGMIGTIGASVGSALIFVLLPVLLAAGI